MLYRFRDVAGYSSKVADFNPPHLHLALSLGGYPGRISRRYFWHQKPAFPGLSRGVVCAILGLALLVELRLVTDGQRDGRTDTRSWLVPRMYSIARYKL